MEPRAVWALAVILVLVGARAEAPALEAAGVGLGLVLAVAWAYARAAARQVGVRRRAPLAALEDDAVDVALEVGSRGVLPIGDLEVEDRFGAERGARKRASLAGTLPAGGSARLGYRGYCDAPRGAHPLGPLVVRVRDPLGLALARHALPGLEAIEVLPRPVALEPIWPEGGGARFDLGQRGPRAPGPGVELSGVRAYVPGDPPRLLHAALSARHGRPIVKLLEDATRAEVWVFLDLHRFAQRGIGAASTLEVSIRAASSIVLLATERGLCVRLVGRSQAPLDQEPAYGADGAARLLAALARVRADGDLTLPELLREAGPLLRPRSVVVLLCSSLGLDLGDYADMLATLAARSVEVVAVLLDARGFLRVHQEHLEHERSAPELAEVAARLAEQGVHVYSVARGEALEARLRLDARIWPSSDDAPAQAPASSGERSASSARRS